MKTHNHVTNIVTYSLQIYVQICEKDKGRPHPSRMSISDIIEMLKLCHNVASQRIQDFLEDFFMFFQYKMRYLVVSKKRIHYLCEDRIEKSVFCDHHLSSLGKPGDANW